MPRAMAKEKPATEKDATLTDSVYRRLKADIIWGRLVPDQALRSEDLISAYEIGVSPLREALSRLSSEALVVRFAQRGFKVAPLDADQVIQISEARVLIEGEALRASIERGDLNWETKIASATHALTRTLSDGVLRPESEAWAVIHRDFHMALISGCGSECLLRIASNLYDHAERHRVLGERWRVDFEASGAVSGRNRLLEHERLAKATMDRDAHTALEQLGRHYLLTARTVVHAIEGSNATSPRLELNRATAQLPRRNVS